MKILKLKLHFQKFFDLIFQMKIIIPNPWIQALHKISIEFRIDVNCFDSTGTVNRFFCEESDPIILIAFWCVSPMNLNISLGSGVG